MVVVGRQQARRKLAPTHRSFSHTITTLLPKRPKETLKWAWNRKIQSSAQDTKGFSNSQPITSPTHRRRKNSQKGVCQSPLVTLALTRAISPLTRNSGLNTCCSRIFFLLSHMPKRRLNRDLLRRWVRLFARHSELVTDVVPPGSKVFSLVFLALSVVPFITYALVVSI